ncbi:MAG: class I SAM-dependent methyltransferase, partial [Anaerolineaceae bacterium]
MPLFDHFNILAPFYEKVIPSGEPERLCELIGSLAGPLLDAGGGTGRVAQYLRGQSGPVVVADLSRKMLLETCRKDGLIAVRAPAEKLPFADGTFSRIIMVDALHHVRSQAHTAAELWRVLRPGGRIVIQEPEV